MSPVPKTTAGRQISIHALREESDPGSNTGRTATAEFQSTLSVRRATGKTFAAKRYGIKISIHALREESDLAYLRHSDKPPIISIHALREESDRGRFYTKPHTSNFNPRSP